MDLLFPVTLTPYILNLIFFIFEDFRKLYSNTYKLWPKRDRLVLSIDSKDIIFALLRIEDTIIDGLNDSRSSCITDCIRSHLIANVTDSDTVFTIGTTK